MHAPIHRDLVREWLDAFRAEGIRVGLYYSLIDWHHPDYPVVGDSLHPERDRPEARDKKRDLNKYLDYMHGQVRELMTNYGKIDILWFDYSYDKMTGETWRATQLMKMVRSLQPAIIVNNRLQTMVANRLGEIGDFATPEQTIPPNGLPGTDWETCMTMNDTWGYKSRDHNWKSTGMLITNLVDIASKGGNYLLNVGPTAEGVIPEASVNRLTQIGRWMSINGESIYGTSASPFEKQPSWGRCTRKALPGGVTRLYLHVFDWPKNGTLSLPLAHEKPIRASLLAAPQVASLACKTDGRSLTISLPAKQPDSYDSVVILDLQP
jgi:alpha-L-fucosidase